MPITVSKNISITNCNNSIEELAQCLRWEADRVATEVTLGLRDEIARKITEKCLVALKGSRLVDHPGALTVFMEMPEFTEAIVENTKVGVAL